ncbi:MAG: phosphate transport system permease protein [Pseudonocardiales bacterium]|jgi:phosphate transport system permease protein|nr:phosphate transport system permease protein [Pseudonocardiales bacterium]
MTATTAAPQAPDVPRVLSARSADDIGSIWGSALAAVSFTWIAYYHLLSFSGIVGFVVVTWFVFLAFVAGVTLVGNPVPVLFDRLATAILTSGAMLILLLVGYVLIFIYRRGWPAYTKANFYTQDMSGVRPTAPLTQGGILHAIVGSGIQIGIATAISVPLGVGTAIYLTEVGGKLAQTVRTVVEAMTALPDILAGLFVYTFLIIGLHWDRTGLTVSIALAVTMIPVIARSAEVMLRVVPGGLREAGLALGASRWQVVRRVVVPTARSNLVTSIILGVARIAGETAPLLIVSGATIFFNADPLHDKMNSLPLLIFAGIRSGEPAYEQRAYGAAAVLLTLVLVLFITARFIARDKLAKRARVERPAKSPVLPTLEAGNAPS